MREIKFSTYLMFVAYNININVHEIQSIFDDLLDCIQVVFIMKYERTVHKKDIF